MTPAALPAEPAQLLEMYRSMVQIRTFEDTVQKLYEKALVHGSTHLCQGQEAVAVGWAAALTPDDYTSYTYRGHGHALARGMSPEAAFAEILGRSTGVNRGKGGSMHLTDARLGLMGCFAIVGSGLPVAVGLGRGAQLRRETRVSVTFFGDGASNIGAFHESLNLAAIWKAPVIFVCENNLYGEYSRINLTTTVDDIAVRATAYAMPSQIVDGNDVQAVYQAAQTVVERARTGGGPTLVECKTYRQRGHSRSDAGAYRPPEEVTSWLARDPLIITRRQLLDSGSVTSADIAAVDDSVATAIANAAAAAEQAPWPDLAEITRDVHA